MLVADLNQFLDLPTEAPGPARALATHVCDIVRASTAGAAVSEWTTALPCRRWPARRRCPGRITLRRNESPSSIDWRCAVCGDEGVIANWEASAFDLRRRRPVLAEAAREIVIAADVAAVLRELVLLDTDCERIIFAGSAHSEGAVLAASPSGLDELVDAVAAAANYEPDRSRPRRLDAAYDAVTMSAAGMSS